MGGQARPGVGLLGVVEVGQGPGRVAGAVERQPRQQHLVDRPVLGGPAHPRVAEVGGDLDHHRAGRGQTVLGGGQDDPGDRAAPPREQVAGRGAAAGELVEVVDHQQRGRGVLGREQGGEQLVAGGRVAGEQPAAVHRVTGVGQPRRPAPGLGAGTVGRDRHVQVGGAVQHGALQDQRPRTGQCRVPVPDDADHPAGPEVEGDRGLGQPPGGRHGIGHRGVDVRGQLHGRVPPDGARAEAQAHGVLVGRTPLPQPCAGRGGASEHLAEVGEHLLAAPVLELAGTGERGDEHLELAREPARRRPVGPASLAPGRPPVSEQHHRRQQREQGEPRLAGHHDHADAEGDGGQHRGDPEGLGGPVVLDRGGCGQRPGRGGLGGPGRAVERHGAGLQVAVDPRRQVVGVGAVQSQDQRPEPDHVAGRQRRRGGDGLVGDPRAVAGPGVLDGDGQVRVEVHHGVTVGDGGGLETHVAVRPAAHHGRAGGQWEPRPGLAPRDHRQPRRVPGTWAVARTVRLGHGEHGAVGDRGVGERLGRVDVPAVDVDAGSVGQPRGVQQVPDDGVRHVVDDDLALPSPATDHDLHGGDPSPPGARVVRSGGGRAGRRTAP